MTKLCPRGKAAAKRKFKVYPSAYANAYASKICAGKIKDPSGVKRKDFKGPKPASANRGKMMTQRKLRKERQKNPSETMFKGRDIELTFTDINPFTDALELKSTYGPDTKGRYPMRATYAQKASTDRFRGIAPREVERSIKSKKMLPAVKIKKKALGGFNKVGMHNVMGSPVSVDVDGDTLSNPSASDYYKDLLK
jgi:hypothetical protein